MENSDSNKKDTNAGLILISIGALALIIGLWFFTYHRLKGLDPTDRGTFGDMFGSVNALFSGLALAGIIITILLQKKELTLQREELSETRKEFETQNSTLKIQRFENTFFNLLNLHHQIVNAIDHRYYKTKERESNLRASMLGRKGDSSPPSDEKEIVILTGRDAFRYRYNQMFKELQKTPTQCEEIYKRHYESALTDFGHYFRNLYRIVRFVDQADFFYDQSKVSPEEVFRIKYQYTSMLRAQISDFEFAWLFYNCTSSFGTQKFKPLIERYALLKNIPEQLIAAPDHKFLYNQTAFGYNRT